MGATFSRTLTSIEQSTYPDRQLIVVDDGSDDGCTPQLLASLQQRIDRLMHLPHGGKATAANHGAAAGRGEIIIFLDADSYVVPDFIEIALAELEQHPQIEAIDFVPQVANPDASLWTRIAVFERAMLALSPDNFGALFVIRRRTFEQLQFRTGSAPQFELNQRLLQRGVLHTSAQPVVYSDEPVAFAAMYRRKRRWLYGMLETCRAHGQSPGMALVLPFIDIFLLGNVLPGLFDPRFLLIPGVLLLTWLAKTFFLKQLLGLRQPPAPAYVVYMITLMIAIVEAVVRFRLGRKVPWI
jgi:cellulose synthase/poly-beta-1,6-N-acetylglucosamine synthase-like glycosyltransferase